MTRVKTQINCPNCRQLIPAEIQQLFDVGVDPSAKARLLSGQYNLAQCPHCGFNGMLGTPVVYHDPEKELLLTFIPPELNLPRDEAEKTIGKLINQAVENLPKEQRKGYLFSPQTVLTLQGLVERILQEDGISKEMIEAQQKRVALIQRLAGITDEKVFEKTTKEEDENIDAEFFSILTQMIQLSARQGDRDGANMLNELQGKLIPLTTVGKEIQSRAQEVEAALKTLQDAGEKLDRDKLLEIVLEAPNDDRVDAYVSLARPGMDYEFFAKLTEKVDQAEGKEKERLSSLRERLLEGTREVDEQIQARMSLALQNLNTLLQAEDIREATLANLPAIDEYFIQTLEVEMNTAEKAKDKDRLEKMQQVVDAIEEAAKAITAPSELLEKLLDADEEERKKLFEEHAQEITPAFIESLTSLLVRLDGPDNVEMADKVRAIYRQAVRFSMQSSMKEEGKKEAEESKGD
ncbi:MAG: CpXC domain-containing protein [Anaerolineales bacterium]|jgi:hypothetical protein